MNFKTLVLAASAVSLVGGVAFAPGAHAEEDQCGFQGTADGVVSVYGTAPGDGGGCLVVEGEGVPVTPLKNGYIGIYQDADGNPALYGSCEGRTADNNEFQTFDPSTGDTDAEGCSPV